MKPKLILIAAAALAFTAACGGPKVQLAAPGTEPVTAAQLATLHERIAGSREDRSAAAFLQYVAFQKPIRDCMARNGFHYTPPPFDDPYASWPKVRPMSYIDVLVPIDEAQIARGLYLAEDHRATQQQPPNPGFDKLSPADRKTYLAKSGACSPPPGTYENEIPKAALELAWKLEETLANRLASSEMLRKLALGDYPVCMNAAGYPVKDRRQLTEYVRGNHFEWVGTDEKLRKAFDAEVAAARADATCRTESYSLAMRLIGSVLTRFENDHASRIADVEATWIQIRSDAAAARSKVDW